MLDSKFLTKSDSTAFHVTKYECHIVGIGIFNFGNESCTKQTPLDMRIKWGVVAVGARAEVENLF